MRSAAARITLVISLLATQLAACVSAHASDEGPGSINALLTAVAQQSTGVAPENHGAASWRLDLSAGLTLGECRRAYIKLRSGDGVDIGKLLHTVADPNGDFVNTGAAFHGEEAWYEWRAPEGRTTVTAGWLHAKAYVDQNAVANTNETQFLNKGFANALTIKFPKDRPGIEYRYWLRPVEPLTRRPGLRISALAMDPANDSGQFYAVEVALADEVPDLLRERLQFEAFAARPERLANSRAYLWQNTADATTGWGLSLDRPVSPAGTVFARYGQGTGSVARIWSLGGQLAHGDQTTVGLAYNNSERAADGAESVTEAHYRFPLARGVTLTADLQHVHDIDGGADSGLVWGLRVGWHR